MSYPQPDTSAPVYAGQGFLRLNTELVSPGDIYESAVGAKAFAVGPDSDLANIAIDYYDETKNPTFVNGVVISPQRTFVGPVSAANGSTYQPSGVPGRILFRPKDLYNPLVSVGTLIGTAVDESVYAPVRLDVIEYFTDQPSLGPPRRDKEFYFQKLLQNPAAHNKIGVAIPYYGRKSGSYLFRNRCAQPVSFGLFAVNYEISANGGYIVSTPVAIAAVAANASVRGVLLESALGMFDAVVAYVDFTGVITRTAASMTVDLRIDVSDTPLSNAAG